MRVVVLGLVAFGCSDGVPSGPTFDPTAPGVHARSTFDSIFVGRSGRVVAIATGDSAAVAWPRFAWSTSDSLVARVDSTGLVLAVAPGSVWIRAQWESMRDSVRIVTRLGMARGTDPVLRVALSGSRQCALLVSGAAACAEVAEGDSIPTLVAVDGTATLAFTQLSASATHVCGVVESGAMYCWGSNWRGAFMTGATDPSGITTPILTPVRAGGDRLFSMVTVGANFTCATERSTLQTLCAGLNSSRELGRVTSGGVDSVPASIAQGSLSTVRGSVLTNTESVRTCVVTIDDRVVCWGGSSTTLPSYTEGGSGIVAVTRGAAHVCTLSAAGQVRCTGTNAAGQLGSGTVGTTQVSVDVASTVRFTAISAAASYTCAIAEGGALYCWGDFPNPRLRDSFGTWRRAPVRLLEGVRFTSINANPTVLCGVTTEQQYLCL